MADLIYKQEVYTIIGTCMEVHNQLGNGFLEAVYQEALALELKERGIPFQKEVRLEINYKGRILEKYYIADFVCYDGIIIELKALNDTLPVHEAQVLNYLKASNNKLGLLVNFGKASLQYKRLVNEYGFLGLDFKK